MAAKSLEVEEPPQGPSKDIVEEDLYYHTDITDTTDAETDEGDSEGIDLTGVTVQPCVCKGETKLQHKRTHNYPEGSCLDCINKIVDYTRWNDKLNSQLKKQEVRLFARALRRFKDNLSNRELYMLLVLASSKIRVQVRGFITSHYGKEMMALVQLFHDDVYKH